MLHTSKPLDPLAENTHARIMPVKKTWQRVPIYSRNIFAYGTWLLTFISKFITIMPIKGNIADNINSESCLKEKICLRIHLYHARMRHVEKTWLTIIVPESYFFSQYKIILEEKKKLRITTRESSLFKIWLRLPMPHYACKDNIDECTNSRICLEQKHDQRCQGNSYVF